MKVGPKSSLRPFLHRAFHLFVYLFIYLRIYLFIYYLFIEKIGNLVGAQAIGHVVPSRLPMTNKCFPILF